MGARLMPPVVGAFVGIAGFLGMSATQLAIGLLATAARFGLSYYEAQRAKQEAKKRRTDIEQNVPYSVEARYNVLGIARVGGVILFREASGTVFYLATILADDIIDGVDAYYINNVECLVDGDGYVTTPPFNTSYGKLVRVELHYGYTDQPASTILQAAFPGVWTSAHTASGVAYMVTALTQPNSADFQTVYSSTVPPIAALVRGVLAYDPRDGDQDPAVASSWTTTTNPALLLLYYFTATNGMGLSRSLFDGDLFSAAADFCDGLITTKSKGVRKRYEMGGVYSYDEDPVDIIQRILDTFGGRIFVTAGGLFGLSCDELDVPEIVITEDMIIDIEAKRYTGALYEYTTIKSKFTSEDHGYLNLNEEADPWIDETALGRIGRQIPYSFDLPYVLRHDQARRLMKRKFYDLTPEWTVDLALDYNGIELFGERVFRLVYPALGIDGTFRLEAVSPDAELGFARIAVRAVSVSASASEWDAEAEEGTAPAIPPATSETAAPQTPTGLAALVGDTGGTIRALLTWSAYTTGKGQEAQWKLTSDSTWTTVAVAAADRGYTLSALTSGADYDFRVRVTDAKYGVSSWAAITFTATAVAGATAVLQSLAASGGVLSIAATAQQAADSEAAYIEFVSVAHLAAVSWTGSTTVPAISGQTVTATITSVAGSRDVYARSIGINGDVSAESGPIAVTVTSTVSTGGSSGSGGGGGGSGKNDGGSSTGHSESPSQQGGIY